MFDLANAVRYGTARAEWFLNAVNFTPPRNDSFPTHYRIDGCPPLGRGDSDA